MGGDNDKALVDGKAYISKAKGTLGLSLRGKAPIWDEKRKYHWDCLSWLSDGGY
ncbi:hypothetical protein GCM10020331_086830 [Ectobacillus funiculus]